jgi:hypothetical protein
MAKRSALILLLLIGLIIILFHEPIVEMIESAITPADARPVIATMEEHEGAVKFKLPKTLVYKNVKDGLGLRDQDTLVTSSDGTAVISFKSGFKLSVQPNSVIVIEQPQVGADGAIRVTFLRGDFRVLNAGAAGSLILQKDNIVQDAAGRAPPKAPVVVSMKPQALPPPPKPEIPPPAPVIKTEVIEDIKKTVEKPKPQQPRKPRDTLPDEYIAQIVKQQTPFFNRCYAEHLRLNPNARGRINLAFTIVPNGSVSSVRLLGSTLKDPRLEQCTMSVIERVRFKKYDGDPIVINYPINFE